MLLAAIIQNSEKPRVVGRRGGAAEKRAIDSPLSGSSLDKKTSTFLFCLEEILLLLPSAADSWPVVFMPLVFFCCKRTTKTVSGQSKNKL